MKNEVLENIMTRRTIRRYKQEQIKKEELDIILNAGLYAPSAGSRQGVIFVVSQDKEINEKLGRIKKKNSNVRMSTDTVYISKEQPSIADDSNIKNAFYDAPTVITVFVPKDFLYGPYDASVAAENMLIAAHSIGIGGCFIGSAWDSFDAPYGKQILQQWNIDKNYYACVQLTFGYPSDEKLPDAKPRKKGRVIFC